MKLTHLFAVSLLASVFAAPLESPTLASRSFPQATRVLPSPTTASRSIAPQTAEQSYPPGYSPTTAPRAPDITGTAAVRHELKARQNASTTLPDNPWAVHCPIPKNFTLTSFRSTSVPAVNGTVSLKISYNSTGTFTCPHAPIRYPFITYREGVYSMNCDVNGLVFVRTDGFSWVYIEEDFYCSDFKNVGPRPADTMGTVANHTSLAASLNCEVDSNNTKTCVQSVPDIQIPIQIYRGAGVRGREPIDVNGTELEGCPPMTSSVIVYDTSVCSTTAPVPMASIKISRGIGSDGGSLNPY